MLGYEEIVNSYRFVTSMPPAPSTWGELWHWGGEDANFVILDAKDWYDALNYDAAILRSYRRGKLIASAAPVDKQVFF